MNILESYEKNGYYLARSVFDKSFCKKLLNYLDTLESKVTLPFTNIPWGYGNVLNKGLFRKVTNNKLISNFCRDKFGDFVFNHLFVHNSKKFESFLDTLGEVWGVSHPKLLVGAHVRVPVERGFAHFAQFAIAVVDDHVRPPNEQRHDTAVEPVDDNHLAVRNQPGPSQQNLLVRPA